MVNIENIIKVVFISFVHVTSLNAEVLMYTTLDLIIVTMFIDYKPFSLISH